MLPERGCIRYKQWIKTQVPTSLTQPHLWYVQGAKSQLWIRFQVYDWIWVPNVAVKRSVDLSCLQRVSRSPLPPPLNLGSRKLCTGKEVLQLQLYMLYSCTRSTLSYLDTFLSFIPSFFPYTNRQHCQPSYWIHPLDSKARLHARRNCDILRPLTANRSLCL